MLTCATRFSVLGSENSISSDPDTSLPSIDPLVRNRWVSIRVSTPVSPGTLCSRSQSSRDRVAVQ